MIPLRLDPAYQHYVWGGERIPSYFQRPLPIAKYAESWEVSDRKEGMSHIANGPWKGKTFQELLHLEKEAIIGKGKSWEKFPLLVKIIDSRENLSVQVHPDESAALRFGAEAKSEMWIALEDSSVYVGLLPHVAREDFLKALEGSRVHHLLNKFDLKKGDAIYVPAGTVHAVCSGAFLLEVQQNSNTTYRLYDWGRIGRQIHLEEGLSCIHWGAPEAFKISPSFSQADGQHRLESLISNDHFIVDRLEILNRWQIKSHTKTCQILFCVRGEAIIENEPLRIGMTYLIPASSQPMSISGHCQLISVRLP